MIRSLAEHVSRNVVLRRRLPSDFGGRFIYVTPDSALRFWRWNLEKIDPGLLNAARLLVSADSVVWDIGANVGIFSFSSAAKAKTVLAVEPDPWLVTLLNRSACRFENVTVLPAALGDVVGIGELNIAQRGRAANFISGFGTTQTGGTRCRRVVVTVTLDWLAERFPLPDVLKIDVEAMERVVLAGGESLFKRTKPIVICEVASNNSGWVTDFLSSFGYCLHDELLRPSRFATDNTIALPFGTRQTYTQLPGSPA